MINKRILSCFSPLGVVLLVRQQWLTFERRVHYLYLRWIVREPLLYRHVSEKDPASSLGKVIILVYWPTLHDVFEWHCRWHLTRLQLWDGHYPAVNAYCVLFHEVNHETMAGVAVIQPCRVST